LIKTSPYKKLISLKRQPLVLLIFSSISFLLILFRLIFLQLLNYESFKKMSDENRIRLIASQPIRGKILDKNGYVLADTRVKYSLIIKPQSVNKSNWEKHKSSISNLLNIDINVIQKKYSDGLKNQKLSVTILDDLNVDQLIKFKENENNLSELDFGKAENQKKHSSPWKIKSWKTEYKNEGYFDEKLHASWIHLHLPSSLEVAKNFIDATQITFSKHS